LERYCHMPSLGIIPLWTTNGKISLGRGKKSLKSMEPRALLPGHWSDSESAPESEIVEMIVSKAPESLFAESIRQAHTSIMLSAPGRPPCVLIVTSPNPSEGKSMFAANLALSFAQNHQPTVLIDCDLRRPRIHQILRIDSQPGLTNFLSGGAALEEIIRSTAFPNLMVITSGPRSPNPGSLLNSESFEGLLTQLSQQFQHIIIDTPPILAFADGRIISPLADGVLLVAKYNSTTKGAGLLSQQLLSKINAPILGAVLNCVDKHAQSYGGYYYNYHYKYYSYYRDNKVN
jgi:capsular exopolysaccharide synthesis family protein